MDRVRVNNQIKAAELRVIGETGENLGVLPLPEALRMAEEKGLDLIEIAPTAVPPVAKIMEYGKFLYIEQKKEKKDKGHRTETKAIQIKVGTGEHDLALKAKKVSEWLSLGHRVKVELFLSGRLKYLDATFLKERLNRLLNLITTNYKVADEFRRGPKGPTMIIEKV